MAETSIRTFSAAPLRYRERRNAARTASLMALVAGLVNLLSAALPEQRIRLRALDILVPGEVTTGAFVVTTAAGIGLIFLSGALRRRSRLAWWVTLVLLIGSSVAHIARGLDIEEASIEAFFAGYLVGQQNEFRARFNVRDRLGFVLPGLLVVGTTLLYGIVGLSLRNHGLVEDSSFTDKFEDTVRMALGFGTNLGLHKFGRFFPPSVAALFYAGLVLTIVRAVAPALRHRQNDKIGVDEALASTDSLSWFATRDDRHVTRTEDAAIAYGVVGTVGLASGDPFGPAKEWPEVIDAFLLDARSQGLVPAVIGCSEQAGEAYNAAGMSVRYMGDEAILNLEGFTVEGGSKKVARQSWNRAKRAGYTATVVRERDLDPDVRSKLKAISDHWRGDAAERGFSMALGRLFDERDGDAVFAIGWDGDGNPAGFLHLVPWGLDGVSLDVMRRDRNGPAIFNDFLVVEAALQLPSIGVKRLSLNFSFLRAILAEDKGSEKPPVFLRIQQNVLRKLSGPFQIETLYRFNKKFDPDWQPRYFALEALEDFPRAMFAALRAEGMISLPRRRKKEEAPTDESVEATPS